MLSTHKKNRGVQQLYIHTVKMKTTRAILALALVYCGIASGLLAQSLGNAGTITGTVLDPTGAAVAKAEVTIHNAVSGYMQTVVSGPDGSFRLSNIPPNPYQLEVKAPGFAVSSQNVDIRNSLPIQVKPTLALAGAQTSVIVQGAAEVLETDPSAHVDVDRSQLSKIPAFDPAGGLSQAMRSSVTSSPSMVS